MNTKKIKAIDFGELVTDMVAKCFGDTPEHMNKNQMYRAVCLVVRDLLASNRVEYKQRMRATKAKQVYYMSMEFLLGRSLKNHLHNMCLLDTAKDAITLLGYDIEELFEEEPDAGLGNGGLGRLAAAYMDSLTACGYAACGFSIKYDYGIFKQKIVDGWQVELADDWLNDGAVWLAPRVEDTFEVHFGGDVTQYWEKDKLYVDHKNYTTILAVPYDMAISGYNKIAVNKLRLWSAKAPVDFDMKLFAQGEYVKAMEQKAMAETISKILYPADDHIEGKSLRLKQQYFFVSASIQSILKLHLKSNKSLDNLGERVAIHINDTHPALCIPELMRILLDEYNYNWEQAWKIITETISYTNHTVMAEALEKWPLDLFKRLLPRIYQVVEEINKRFCVELWNSYPHDQQKIDYNAIISHNQVKMANLCLSASYAINGVSALHSDILKDDVFRDYYRMQPHKFTNVTNGITHRRWLDSANPRLSGLITELIGDKFLNDATKLEGLLVYKGDRVVLQRLEEIKLANKQDLAEYIYKTQNIKIDPTSIFDVQVKRLHEYKRQLLNVLNIIDMYYRIKDNPNLDIVPRTFIFGAKAASSYYMAKLIMRLICALSEVIEKDPQVRDKIKVVFVENYRVTLAEMIMPASEISEQISIAGKEASGTGNMKFMINGAITLGTMDGANIEISENVGKENIVIFGMLAEEVSKLYLQGYNSSVFYNNNSSLKRVIDSLRTGFGGINFGEIADSLLLGKGGLADSYMVLADFESYKSAQAEIDTIYRDRERFNRMSLINIAKAGFFTADRSVREYANKIWNLSPIADNDKL